MTFDRRVLMVVGVAAVLMWSPSPAPLQAGGGRAAKPANLEVLPRKWSYARLQPVMTGFSRALEVSCTHCHQVADGGTASTVAWAVDDNPNKERARDMLGMLGESMMHLDAIDPGAEAVIEMWCDSCHRGRATPNTLQEESEHQRVS